MTNETKNKPVEKVRVGNVQIAIFKNVAPETEGVYYNAAVELSYKQGSEWKRGNSFGLRELVHLAKASLMAHSVILKLQADDRRGSADDADTEEAA